jgi:hypothetical protein
LLRARASYDLTRLRRNRLIARVHGRNLYRLTADGPRLTRHSAACVSGSTLEEAQMVANLKDSQPHRA